ncbi:hypothetical protein OCH239_17205 [Roseivivax halodurans JCM 10272]|uniref:HTH araC/xylS-type domain-containing protein n=1 Tax=Roseivivax halodurans JCM 10272 TaxID=1449350 RepID=X7ECC6_9RHOB|nr:hypothetical protein OCH239_17205 [Roseivivax halodurans JCM 10272]
MRWRQFDTILAAYWEAVGNPGSRGYYVSANPRLSFFFDDVSAIEVIGEGGPRPMARAIYVPAGMVVQTAFTRPLAFSHLDIHMDLGWAVGFLSGSMSRTDAIRALERPAERADIAGLEEIAGLLVGEIGRPLRPDLYAQALSGSLLAAMLDIGGAERLPGNARLTAAQMGRVTARFDAGGGRRMPVAEMAAAVNLSESWFSQVFKNTTGVTPQRWQLDRRMELAQGLLTGSALTVADIAERLGFSDQAHFTRSFRHAVGMTPAAWRRQRLLA